MVTLGIVTGSEKKKNRDGSIAAVLLQVQMSAVEDVQTVQYMPSSGEDSPPQEGDKVVVLELGTAFKLAVGVQDAIAPAINPGERKVYSRSDAGAIAAFMLLANSGDIEFGGVKFTVNATGDITLDAGGGAATITIQTDGTIEIANAAGFIILASSGIVNINGVMIDPTGNIIGPANITAGGVLAGASLAAGGGTMAGGTLSMTAGLSAPSVVAAGKELAGHDHPSADPPANTGPNN